LAQLDRFQVCGVPTPAAFSKFIRIPKQVRERISL